MIIDHRPPAEVIGAYRTAAAGSPRPVTGPARQPAGAPRNDRVTLSERGNELRQVLKAIRSTPDTREESIRALREQLARGTYEPNGGALAARLLQDGGN